MRSCSLAQSINCRMNDNFPLTEFADWTKLPAKPLVSVFMLAYQHEKFIAEAIESVVEQKCPFPIELIIGEDCSLDNTRTIALTYQHRHPSLIRVITSDANVGITANVSRCQNACRGEYIAICEGDDYWCDATKLARQIDEFERFPHCSLIFHPAYKRDAISGLKTGAVRWSLRSRMFSLSEIIAGDGGLIPTASILVRRAVAISRPKWAESSSIGDYPLAIKAALAGDVRYINRTMAVYRTNVPGSWMQRNFSEIRKRLDHARNLERMLLALQLETGLPIGRPARSIISKHYSDIVVRLDADRGERARIYGEIKLKLIGSDKLLAWLAARYEIRLPKLKSLVRKVKTLTRLSLAEVKHGIS